MIYWIKVALSIIIAAISAFVATLSDAFEFNTFLNSAIIALLGYILSYYVLKAKFYNKVETLSTILFTILMPSHQVLHFSASKVCLLLNS